MMMGALMVDKPLTKRLGFLDQCIMTPYFNKIAQDQNYVNEYTKFKLVPKLDSFSLRNNLDRFTFDIGSLFNQNHSIHTHTNIHICIYSYIYPNIYIYLYNTIHICRINLY